MKQVYKTKRQPTNNQQLKKDFPNKKKSLKKFYF